MLSWARRSSSTSLASRSCAPARPSRTASAADNSLLRSHYFLPGQRSFSGKVPNLRKRVSRRVQQGGGSAVNPPEKWMSKLNRSPNSFKDDFLDSDSQDAGRSSSWQGGKSRDGGSRRPHREADHPNEPRHPPRPQRPQRPQSNHHPSRTERPNHPTTSRPKPSAPVERPSQSVENDLFGAPQGPAGRNPRRSDSQRTRTEKVSRPETVSRPEKASRPETASRPEKVSRPEKASQADRLQRPRSSPPSVTTQRNLPAKKKVPNRPPASKKPIVTDDFGNLIPTWDNSPEEKRRRYKGVPQAEIDEWYHQMVVSGRIDHPDPPVPTENGDLRYLWENRLVKQAMPISRRSPRFVDPSKVSPEEFYDALNTPLSRAPELPEIPSMDALEIPKSTQASLRALGIEELTPVQADTLPVLREGHSAMLRAPPGTGKTFAFLLPGLTQLEKGGRVVIVAPNATLAEQTLKRLHDLLRFDHPRRKKIFSWMDPSADPDTPLDENAEPLEDDEFDRQFNEFAKQVFMRDSVEAQDTRPLDTEGAIPVSLAYHRSSLAEQKKREQEVKRARAARASFGEILEDTHWIYKPLHQQPRFIIGSARALNELFFDPELDPDVRRLHKLGFLRKHRKAEEYLSNRPTELGGPIDDHHLWNQILKNPPLEWEIREYLKWEREHAPLEKQHKSDRERKQRRGLPDYEMTEEEYRKKVQKEQDKRKDLDWAGLRGKSAQDLKAEYEELQQDMSELGSLVRAPESESATQEKLRLRKKRKDRKNMDPKIQAHELQQSVVHREWRDRVATFLLMGRYLGRMRAGLQVQGHGMLSEVTMVVCDEIDVLIPASSIPFHRKNLRMREQKHPWRTCLFLEKVYDAVEARLIHEQKALAPVVPKCFQQGPITTRAVFTGRIPLPPPESETPGRLGAEYTAHLKGLQQKAASGDATAGAELSKALALLPEHSQPESLAQPTQTPPDSLDQLLEVRPYPKQPIQLVLCSAAATSQHRSPFHRWMFEHGRRIKRVAPVHYEHWYGDLPDNLQHFFVECPLPTARWDPHITPDLLRKGQVGSVWALRAHIRGLERMARPVLDAHQQLRTQRRKIKQEMRNLGRQLAELQVEQVKSLPPAEAEASLRARGLGQDVLEDPDQLLKERRRQLRMAVRHRHRVLRGLEEEIAGLTHLPTEDAFKPKKSDPSQSVQSIHNPNPRLVPRSLHPELPGGLRGRVLVLVPPPYSAASLAQALRDLDLPAEELKPKAGEVPKPIPGHRGRKAPRRAEAATPHHHLIPDEPEPVLQFLTLGWDSVRGIDIPELRQVIVLAPNQEMLRNSASTSLLDRTERLRMMQRQQKQRTYEVSLLKVQRALNSVQRRLRSLRKRRIQPKPGLVQEERNLLRRLAEIDASGPGSAAAAAEGNGGAQQTSDQRFLRTPISEFFGTTIEMQAPPKLHSRVYGHLAGRSARAGRSGTAITMFASDHLERRFQNWELDPRAFGGETGRPTPAAGTPVEELPETALPEKDPESAEEDVGPKVHRYDPTRQKGWRAATPNEHIVTKLERQLNIQFKELVFGGTPGRSHDPETGINLDELDDAEHMRFVLGDLMQAGETIDETDYVEVPEEDEVEETRSEQQDELSDADWIADADLEAEVRQELDEMDIHLSDGEDGFDVAEDAEGVEGAEDEAAQDGLEGLDEESAKAYELLQEMAEAEGLSQEDIDSMMSALVDEDGEVNEERLNQWMEEEEEVEEDSPDVPDSELESMLRDAEEDLGGESETEFSSMEDWDEENLFNDIDSEV